MAAERLLRVLQAKQMALPCLNKLIFGRLIYKGNDIYLQLAKNRKVSENKIFVCLFETTAIEMSISFNIHGFLFSILENEMPQDSERMQSLHSKLHQEAEKIRQWKTSTEIELKQKVWPLKDPLDKIVLPFA